jgi:hypothetical protein
VVAFLGFLDDEPGCGALLLFAKPCETEMVALRREQRVLGVLRSLLDEGSPQAADELPCGSPLTSELVARGVLALVRERVRAEDGARLVELAPSLMAFIAVEYLGQAATGAELAEIPPDIEQTLALRTQPDIGVPTRLGERAHTHVPVHRQAELPSRVTHRTRLVLRAIATAPRSSNRGVAQIAGLTDEGQASRLLTRLQARGLIENVGAGATRGEPNAWLLTAEGRRMLRLTRGMARAGRPARGDVAGGGVWHG